jgi:26S proteasome regulatory subunit N10
MRNGDYLPTRMESQADAVNLVCNVKTQQNPESTVGVMTMAGRSPEVLVTPTQDLGKILTALHNVTIKGQSKFVSAIQVAQLALKHRQNKNQRQRVIAFVGSPLEDDQKELVKLGKKLKKNNVAVDVINFGETAENQEKLEAFIGAINNNDNSNLLTVPPGPHILSDIIISSPILQDGEGGGPSLPMAGSGMGGGDFDFGVDPSIDPELAMALRISAEEERQRQERAGKTEGDGAAAEGGAAATPAAGGGDAAMADNEDDMLQQALAMSMQQDQKAATPAKDATPAPRPAAAAPGVDVSPGTLAAISASEQMAQDEDEEMRLAMAMSVEGQADKGGAAAAALLQDASFLNNVLSSLPGVDTSDPRVQGVLDGMKQDEDKDKKDGAKGGDKK